MALPQSSFWTITASATTGNVNGSGFNPANANMLTDLTTDTNTANTASPVVSSASYNFVAGDVGHWLYIQAGTNWIPGWYQIASVGSNKATLTATIGTAQITSLGFKAASTVVGCATVGTPTGGTFTIDYSQGNTAIINGSTDFLCTTPSTTVTSATGGFTKVMVGNILHLTATTGTGTLTGWYEIVSWNSGTSIVVDTTPAPTNNMTAGTGYVGGAGRLNGLEDAYGEMLPSGAMVYIKNGTYTLSGAISIASTNGTSTLPVYYIGYDTLPGDSPKGSTRPIIAAGANAITYGSYTYVNNCIFTGTASIMLTLASTARMRYCKFFNSSSSASRSALTAGTGALLEYCEIISQNGNACGSFAGRFTGCYIHDSVNGFATGSGNLFNLINNIFANCSTQCLGSSSATGTMYMAGNTFYGRASSPTGIGLNYTAASVNNHFYNNIFSGLATGISVTTTNSMSSTGAYNNFYNNTTDATLYTKDATDLALDPGFIDISEITFSNGTATGGTATLTSSGADFSSVEDNVDFVRITSSTGGTGTFTGNYLITSHTTTTLTLNNNMGTSGSATSITGYIATGHNYGIGTNMKAASFPGLFQGSDTTSYADIGAVQAVSSGGQKSYTFG